MIQFKHKRDQKMFATLNPILIMIFADMYNFAKERYGIELVVTQTVSSRLIDQKLKRKSPAHSQHRAIDIRTKDIDMFILQDIMRYINNKPQYQRYKYVSLSGEKRLAYYHVGTHEHLHLSIHSRYGF